MSPRWDKDIDVPDVTPHVTSQGTGNDPAYDRFGLDFYTDPLEKNASDEEFADDPFLDAVSLKASLAFDPDAAKRLARMLSEAAEIVEGSGPEKRDKLSFYGGSITHAYNVSAIRKETEQLRKAASEVNASRLVSNIELRALHEQLSSAQLRLNLESQGSRGRVPAPGDSSDDSVSGKRLPLDEGADQLSPARVFLIGGIPIATTAVGAGLLVESVVTHPVTPNPYMALFIFLAGLAFVATAIVVLRERRSS